MANEFKRDDIAYCLWNTGRIEKVTVIGYLLYDKSKVSIIHDAGFKDWKTISIVNANRLFKTIDELKTNAIQIVKEKNDKLIKQCQKRIEKLKKNLNTNLLILEEAIRNLEKKESE